MEEKKLRNHSQAFEFTNKVGNSKSPTIIGPRIVFFQTINKVGPFTDKRRMKMKMNQWFLAVFVCLLCLVVVVRLPEEAPGTGHPVKYIDADDLHELAVANKKHRFSRGKKPVKK